MRIVTNNTVNWPNEMPVYTINVTHKSIRFVQNMSQVRLIIPLSYLSTATSPDTRTEAVLLSKRSKSNSFTSTTSWGMGGVKKRKIKHVKVAKPVKMI